LSFLEELGTSLFAPLLGQLIRLVVKFPDLASSLNMIAAPGGPRFKIISAGAAINFEAETLK
jgi:hypothetical protein